MKLNKYFLNLGFLTLLVCGSIMSLMIFTGNTYTLQLVNTIIGVQGVMIPNKLFDYSVLGNFVGLILIAVGFGLEGDK